MEFNVNMQSPAAHQRTPGPDRSTVSLLAFATALAVTAVTGDQALGVAAATAVSILIGTLKGSGGLATTAAISAGSALGIGDIPTALLSLLVSFLAHRGDSDPKPPPPASVNTAPNSPTPAISGWTGTSKPSI